MATNVNYTMLDLEKDLITDTDYSAPSNRRMDDITKIVVVALFEAGCR